MPRDDTELKGMQKRHIYTLHKRERLPYTEYLFIYFFFANQQVIKERKRHREREENKNRGKNYPNREVKSLYPLLHNIIHLVSTLPLLPCRIFTKYTSHTFSLLVF